MTKINVWDLWEREWKNASKFFQSKGNTKTKSKLKDKWYKDFKDMMVEVENATRENCRDSEEIDCINTKCAENHNKECERYFEGQPNNCKERVKP